MIAASSAGAGGLQVAGAQEDLQDTVTINYPDELPLAALADYVSQTLDLKILYGDELQGKKIILRPSSFTLPRARLLDLLSSALRVEDLAIVEDDLQGFYRIVEFAQMQRVATEVRDGAAREGLGLPGRVVTQVIRVPSGDTKTMAAHLKSFLSWPQAAPIEIAEQGLLIVTDYEAVVARLLKLVELLDTGRQHVSVHLLPVQHADAAHLASQLHTIGQEGYGAGPGSLGQAQILADVVPGKLVVIGTEAQAEHIEQLKRQLDVGAETAVPMKRYAPQHISAKRLVTFLEKLVFTPDRVSGSYQIHVDEPSNQVYLTTSESTHERVRDLMTEVDFPLPPSARRVRAYRPKNRSAAEILDTLTHLLEETSAAFSGSSPGQQSAPDVRRNGAAGAGTQVPPTPPEFADGDAADRALRIIGPDYVLTADDHTNTIIAIGTPDFHAQLAELIDQLDRRRPQVVIEMTLVAVSMSDALDLGFELQALDLGDGWDFLLLSEFGISTTDLTTGQRVLTPGVGGTGVLFNPMQTPIILRALATHGKSKVISMPRIVVMDNSTGTLRSVDEAPFTSVNASDTVATTSFAGFESAGTTLTVTPHIADGDPVLLDYSLNFSNFTGSASGPTAPPPRTTNSFSSTVQVPDGYTVVVGGLEIENEADSISEIPLLGRIPLLGYLFQSNSASRTSSRVFAFIRPVILRDDQFEDLKYISQAELEAAGIESGDFPPDQAMWMR